MRVLVCVAACCLLTGAATTVTAKSAESIDCSAVPAAVLKAAMPHTAKSLSPPACERMTEGASVLFEVKVTSPAGRMQEWLYRPDGTLEESEEEIPASEVPANAMKAIRQTVSGGQLRKVDKLQRGKQVLYEGEYTLDGVKRKVIVDAAGRKQS